MRRGAAVAFVVALAASSVPALAQDRASRTEARRLFDEATVALNTGRFAEARDLLRRSLALAPNAGSAFNLAVALRGTGEPLEALEVFDRLLAGAFGGLDAAKRAQCARLRTETDAEVAVLHITVRGGPAAELRVDGRAIGKVADSERLSWRVDPGPRLVAAFAAGRHVAERRLEMARGGSVLVELVLVPTDAARLGTLIVEGAHASDVLEIVGVARGTRTLSRRLVPGAYEISVSGPSGRRSTTAHVEAGEVLRVRLDQEARSAWKNGWLWTGIGVAVAAIASGVVLMTVQYTRDPVSDPTWGLVETLERR